MATNSEHSPETPALIIGDDPVNVLGVARNLGRHGIPVYRLGAERNGILRSRYLQSTRVVGGLDDCPDGEYLRILEEIAEDIGRKAVIFPLSDIHVLRVSSNAGTLSEKYCCARQAPTW